MLSDQSGQLQSPVSYTAVGWVRPVKDFCKRLVSCILSHFSWEILNNGGPEQVLYQATELVKNDQRRKLYPQHRNSLYLSHVVSQVPYYTVIVYIVSVIVHCFQLLQRKIHKLGFHTNRKWNSWCTHRRVPLSIKLHKEKKQNVFLKIDDRVYFGKYFCNCLAAPLFWFLLIFCSCELLLNPTVWPVFQQMHKTTSAVSK